MRKQSVFGWSVLLSLGVHLLLPIHFGAMPSLASLQKVPIDALRMPGGLAVIFYEHLLGLPREGYTAANLLSFIFWFFPVQRLCRLAGIYDPFESSGCRRPLLFSFLAFIQDEFDKRLFGRQKTGGWA